MALSGEIQGSQGKIFKEKRETEPHIKWCPVLLLALACLILLLCYMIIAGSSDCVLYINGKRNITLNQENCTSALLHSRNGTNWVQVSNEEKMDVQSNTGKLEIRKIMNTTPRGVLDVLVGCFLVMILVRMCFIAKFIQNVLILWYFLACEAALMRGWKKDLGTTRSGNV